MKRLNLFLMAAIVASATFFTSCTADEPVTPPIEQTTVNIALESTAVGSGVSVTGKITALATLESVTLLNEAGVAVANWPVSSFTELPVLKSDVNGVYTVVISGLPEGSYTLKATDKKAVVSNVTFTVGPSDSSLKTLADTTTIYCTIADGSNNSTCASADGSTYAAGTATASQQARIDFVYFNAGGTSLAIYAPSAVPSDLTSAFASWSVKNSTHFALTNTISFATATYADVKVAADAATATIASALTKDAVVVFKTAAGKVGIFQVSSITAGFVAIDNVKINIKVQQ